ncbi:AAA family ATPase [Caldivirga sp.]|uniref:AAA family ATPase n=1 Tax=Caldivirga sp. TaxID=2080243 RepID=UPI003D0D8316
MELRIIEGFNELKGAYSVAIEKIAELLTELTPESQRIIIDAFNRIQSEAKSITSLPKAFSEFSENVSKALSSYVDYLQPELTLIGAYVDGEPVNVVIILPVIIPPMAYPLLYVPAVLPGATAMSEEVINRLVKIGLSVDEANRLLSNQLSRIFSGSIIIPISKANIRPINVHHQLILPFAVDYLPPDKQAELVDLLRKEVNYFYDYRGGQVILNFNSSRISLPYNLMGGGFKALTTMLGLIVMGIDAAVIDEPEAHLHPGFMEVIAKYMIEPRFLNSMQFIMATQSIEFLDYLLNAAKEKNSLNKIRLIRLYLMPNGGIDYEQLSGEEAYDERQNLEADLRGP